MIVPGMKPGGPLGGGWIREGSRKASSTGTAQSPGSMLLEGMLGGARAVPRSPGVKDFAVAESLLSVEGVWVLERVPILGGVAVVDGFAAAEEVAITEGVVTAEGFVTSEEVGTAEEVATREEALTGGVDTCFWIPALGWTVAFRSDDTASLPPFPGFLPFTAAFVPVETILSA